MSTVETAPPQDQKLKHPNDPTAAYAFNFEDLLAKISVTRANLGDFLGSLANNSEFSKLPLNIDALGVFRGKTEFDEKERDDFYEDPRPFRTGAFETHPSLKVPFEQKPGVIIPGEDDLEEAYFTLAQSSSSSVEFANKPQGANGQNVKLWSGYIVLKGDLTIPGSERITRLANGPSYISPFISAINLWGPHEADELSGGITKLERMYVPEPHFLDRSYSTADLTPPTA